MSVAHTALGGASISISVSMSRIRHPFGFLAGNRSGPVRGAGGQLNN
jgi:hypothetical protein